MNNPIVLIKYKFYKFLLKQKNKRAVDAEQKFIKSMTITQRGYYDKVVKMLQNQDTEVVYLNGNLILKDATTIITVELFVNQSFLTYTSNTEKGIYHTENSYSDNSKFFFMQHVEANLNRKRKAILEEKSRVLDSLLG